MISRCTVGSTAHTLSHWSGDVWNGKLQSMEVGVVDVCERRSDSNLGNKAAKGRAGPVTCSTAEK